jgi:UDP:flavonoid glycosyltransferase YjiC (YdhE family)
VSSVGSESVVRPDDNADRSASPRIARMRVLITAAPGVGHLLPVLPLGLAARERGHDVLVGCGATLAPLAERAALAHVDLGPPDLDAIRAELPGFAPLVGRERARRMYADGFASVSAPWLARDALVLADRWRPDVIVHDDMEMGSWIVAEVLGVPHIAIQAAAWRPWQRPALVEPLNAIRGRFGLARDEPLSRFEGDLWLTTRPTSMRDPAIALPSEHRELRPEPADQLAAPVMARPAWLDEGAERPRVAVTLGTVNAGRTDVLGPVVDEIAALDVEVGVGLGADPGSLGPVASNVHVERYVALSELAQWADVVVHHAGAGTTLTSLGAGRPMVLVPLTADQFDNTAAALRTGAALEVDATARRPGQVAAAVRQILGEPAFRAAAQAVALEIAAMPGPDAAWREVEAVIAGDGIHDSRGPDGRSSSGRG